MINHSFKRVGLLLFFAFCFCTVQRLAAQEIDYKLGPNLQPMKDNSHARFYSS